MALKQRKTFELRVCHFDKGKMTCRLSKAMQFNVIPKKHTRTYNEKEDAGGGWYYSGKGKKATVELTHYLVHDSSGNYIGKILESSSHKFLKPDTYHIQIPLTSIRFLSTQ
jgi:hypothetical protein